MAKLTLIAIVTSSILLVTPAASSAIKLATEIYNLVFKEARSGFVYVRALILYQTGLATLIFIAKQRHYQAILDIQRGKPRMENHSACVEGEKSPQTSQKNHEDHSNQTGLTYP